jgi:hypothetical protein
VPIFLVFQIIITIKLDRGPLWNANWRSLFSPLFIFFGTIALIATIWSCCISMSIIDLICN